MMIDFDIKNSKKASELQPVFFYMKQMSAAGFIRKVESDLHETPSYVARNFYKPLTTCINLPTRVHYD